MPFVAMRDLQRNTAQIVNDAAEIGKPVVVTRHGKPVAILTATNEDAFEDCVLARLPDLTADTEAALAAAESGTARTVEDVIADIRAGA